MAKTKTPAANLDHLVGEVSRVLIERLGYSEPTPIDTAGGNALLCVEQGRPALIVHLVVPGEPIDARQQDLAQMCAAEVDGGPADYVWATNNPDPASGYFFSWLEDREISELPTRQRWQENVARAVSRPQRRAGSAEEYNTLQKEFDDLHEYIYAARENVNSKNDITYELCKCIFLKMHLERDPNYVVPGIEEKLETILAPASMRARREDAVAAIKKAFAAVRELPDYTVRDDAGHSFRIFDPVEAIRLNKPDTFVRIMEMLTKHSLRNLDDEVLGRAFDVMLRAKFESKGGVGIYLTPQPVRDAMIDMALHDILSEDRGALTRRDLRTGRPAFRLCDPCCGSGGFLVTAMRRVRKAINDLMGLDDEQKARLLREIYEDCFIGADNAPGMVLMARINMAMHGDPKARVFQVDNSLTAGIFLPESFDLIITNPPFKKGGIKAGSEHGDEILAAFRSDILPDGRCGMAGDRLAMGAKPDSKGVWRPVKSVDPAVLFIDRCLQLLKPGGRLVIVVPDGVLCNSGDRYFREYLLGVKDAETGRFVGGKAVVRAVVSLPPVTFRLSGAGAKTSFLYVQKKRPGDQQGPIYMAVANRVGFDVKANKEIVQEGGKPIPNDLVKIVEVYRQGPAKKLQ
jgi:type I restriction enzyme M protein